MLWKLFQIVFRFFSDGVSFNSESVQTCCNEQHSAAVTGVSSGSKQNIKHADYVAPTAEAANDFELLAEHQVCSQPDQPDKDCLSSNTDVKLKKYNDQILVTWQRTRSLVMALLGLIVRLSFSSVFLSRFMQVISYTYHVCYRIITGLRIIF